MMKVREYYLADILVVGGDLAGCRAALEANEFAASVIIVDQGTVGGAIASSAEPGEICAAAVPTQFAADSWQQFFDDSLRYGDGLADRELLATVARHALQAAWDLERYGYPWSRDAEGAFVLSRGNGHQFPRLLTPREEQQAAQVLGDHVRKQVGMQVLDNVYVTALIQYKGRVVGAVGIDKEHEAAVVMTAGSTILATGQMEGLVAYGAGKGSGVGMGYRIGAALIAPELQSYGCEGRDGYECTGGLKIDRSGRTTVPGLYAAGGVTGGIFGSRILPGCEMASALVFAAIAGRTAAIEQTPIPRIKEEGVKEEMIRLQRFLRRMGRGRNATHSLAEFTEKINGICRTALKQPESAKVLGELWEQLASYDSHWYVNVRRESRDVRLSDLVDWIEVDYLLTLARIVVRSLQIRLEGAEVDEVAEHEELGHRHTIVRHESGEDRLEMVSAGIGDVQLSPT